MKISSKLVNYNSSLKTVFVHATDDPHTGLFMGNQPYMQGIQRTT